MSTSLHSASPECEAVLIFLHIYLYKYIDYLRHTVYWGCLGGSVSYELDFGSGHILTAHGFEPCVELCADSSEPGAFFGFSASEFMPSFLTASPLLVFSLKNK